VSSNDPERNSDDLDQELTASESRAEWLAERERRLRAMGARPMAAEITAIGMVGGLPPK